jgi:hypothetical protein
MGAAETISKSLGMARPPSMACLGVVEPRPMPVGMVSVIPMKLEVVWSPHLASSFFFFFLFFFWPFGVAKTTPCQSSFWPKGRLEPLSIIIIIIILFFQFF